MAQQVFLLSPANCSGRRAAMLLRAGADFPQAAQLRRGDLTLGDAFAFMSGLYFRGKLTYALRFSAGAVLRDRRVLVITPTRGLRDPLTPVTPALIREFAGCDVDAANPVYRSPLESDLAALATQLEAAARVVLLGSIATGKYVDVLHPALGDRLVYPPAFIGRGDMSRGGLLLRHAASGDELPYEPIRAGQRPTGHRPAKLPPAHSRRS